MPTESRRGQYQRRKTKDKLAAAAAAAAAATGDDVKLQVEQPKASKK
jgi:hypothetical protein